jgi:hypothetical protein
MLIVFAHTGHVLIDLPIYLGPVIIIAAWLKISSWREKRSATRSSSSSRARRDER